MNKQTGGSVMRSAATLVLARDGAAGLEVFMLQRTAQAAFLGGAYVFPGGALDAADADPAVLAHIDGLTQAQANERLRVSEGALAYWIAAIRETFEEGGILVAVDGAGRALDVSRVASLARR